MPDRPLSPENLRRAILNSQLDDSEDPATQAPPAKADHHLMHALGLPVFAGGQVADIVTTLQALKRPGAYEANPLFGENPSAGRVIATKAAVGIPIAYALDKLADTHPKVALALALAGGGAMSAIAARNTKQGRK